MLSVTQSIEFGVFLTLGLYVLSSALVQRYKYPWMNPLMLSIVFGFLILWGLNIPYENYAVGGNWIAFLLGPATVCLVIPFYRQSHLFKAHWKPILTGIFAGALAGVLTTILLLIVFDFPESMRHALLTKNSTGPIALEIAELLGRPKDLVMLMVVGSGLFGFIAGNQILRFLSIRHPVARGITFGATSHIIGTAKAMTNSKEEGAMSSVAILITGLVYLALVPVILYFWR